MRAMPARKMNRANAASVENPTPARGPKPSLSKGQIAHAAIAIADSEGLASVTMQRVAREVGLTTMALYRYFPGKAEVVALMIDSAADSPLDFGKPSSPWGSRLKNWAHRCLAIYKDHPWFLEATTARRSKMGPNELAWMEAALAMLRECGLGPQKRHRAFFTIIGYVRGHATFQQAGGKSDGAEEEWIHELDQTLQRDPNHYPALLDVLRSGALSETVAAAFDFGIECILDGIRAQVRGADRST